jgi:hypothetical protein
MLGLFACPIRKCCLALLVFSLVANFTWAQSETATVSGQVVDPSGLNVTGAQVKLVDVERDTSASVTTNNTGSFTFPSVRPGRYRMEVTAAGFKVINATGLTVNVQDHLDQNFKLAMGSVSESVTVEGGASVVDAESAAVSTVVDRNFAENLPMNGRSFQTLVQLTPGVVLTTSNADDAGQFSVNGQRSASNYWMVDGVSANIGIGVNANSNPGNGLSGTVGSFSVLGGTNSLVSVDALQEFRIQTSTYAPEFGRTPGGQISIVTRSGTDQFHGTAFDYFRNDVFDANNWFNTAVRPTLPKAKERQNDFGGTLSGPIVKNRAFFFFSYEGLRLRLPETALTTVPGANPADPDARQNAVLAMQPFLKAYPLPNGPQATDAQGNPIPGAFQLNASYSDPASLDAYGLRIDYKLNNKVNLFGRFVYSPSSLTQRGGAGAFSLSTLSATQITTQTGTLAVIWTISPVLTNDLRFNSSSTKASSHFSMDNFEGAVPLTSVPFPNPFNLEDANFQFAIQSLKQNEFIVGDGQRNSQRQINIVDSLSFQANSHSLKFGVDFRRLTPQYSPHSYDQFALFGDIPTAQNGNLIQSSIDSNLRATFLFRNLGIYAQDTWRIVPRLSVTYGVRWDVDFAPSSLDGPSFTAATGFNLNDLSQLGLAPPGTRPFKTTYENFAPRVGVAYQLLQRQEWPTLLRGGFGVFYDLATSEAGNATFLSAYPFGAFITQSGGTFPLSPAETVPPPITIPSPGSGTLAAYDPNLKLPYTLEWNVALEQGLGKQQTISTSYVGAAGRRLLQSSEAFLLPNIFQAQLVSNSGSSDYDALQVQYQRHLLRGLQTLASYTWSHAIDTGSAGSLGALSNALVPSAGASTNRGPADFDIRHALTAGVTYVVPILKMNALTNLLLEGWSVESVVQARSAPPINVSAADLPLGPLFGGFVLGDVRPDVVPGQPLYLDGSTYPGGKAFNPLAFKDPPLDPNTFFPLRQGNVPRNFLRGFGATQWDFAVHRDFPVHESLKLQFRAELFNVLNHPNFGPPSGQFGLGGFGLSSQMLGQSLAGGTVGGGGLSPLYQIGGPRSAQLALKLLF